MDVLRRPYNYLSKTLCHMFVFVSCYLIYCENNLLFILSLKDTRAIINTAKPGSLCLLTVAVHEPLSESEDACSSSDSGVSSTKINPFSRQGGTILLPAPPAPGPHHHQASGSSLGLQLSQGYTQMYGGRSNDER